MKQGIHSRQPSSQSKNSKHGSALRNESMKGLPENNNISSSPTRYNSLIQRFNKKPDNIENPHFKYLQNGIKDVNSRNKTFLLKSSESTSSLQHPERFNAHKIIIDPFYANQFGFSSQNTQFTNIQGNHNNNNNNCHDQIKKTQSNVKQGSVKPIRTICLNLFDQKDQKEENRQTSKSNTNRQLNEQILQQNSEIQNLNNTNKSKIQCESMNLGRVQQQQKQQQTCSSQQTIMSNSTRFSPRYSQKGMNLQQTTGQKCSQLDSSNQGSENIFVYHHQSSESDLNQNDSTITTPTKYQQFSQYPYSQILYGNQTNNECDAKQIQISKESKKSNQQKRMMNSSNHQQQQISPQMQDIIQAEEIINNRNNSQTLRHKQSQNSSPNHGCISKVNLSYLLRNTSKQISTQSNTPLTCSNLHSRNNSIKQQCTISDLHNQKNSHIIGQNNINIVDYKHNSIQNNIQIQGNYSRLNSSNKQLNNSSNKQLNNSSNKQLNNSSSNSSSSQAMNTSSQINNSKILSSFNPFSKKQSKETIKLSTPFASKKASAHFQQEDIRAIHQNQITNNKNTQNFNATKHLTSTTTTTQQNANLVNRNNYDYKMNQLSLIQSCNINALELVSSTASQNSQNNKKQVDRDRSKTYTLFENYDGIKRQRSNSKGNMNMKNKSVVPSVSTRLNKSITKNLNQSNGQLNTSINNINSTLSAIVPSQNSQFNFQPSFFTPIDSECLQKYLNKQTSRDTSQSIDNINNTIHSQTNHAFSKNRSSTQSDLFATVTSFLQLESQVENNSLLNQPNHFKKLKFFQ